MPDNFPTPIEPAKVCQVLSTILSRQKDNYVRSDEMGKLQSDLERLLSDAEARLTWLQSENESVDASEKGLSSDSSDSPSLSSSHTSPKQKLGCKRGPGRPVVNERVKNIKLGNPKQTLKNKSKKNEPVTPVVDKAPAIISDAPHKFWQTLDAWCSDITVTDVKRLQELTKSQECTEEHYKVPTLGTHYSQRWAMEDMLLEQREGTEPGSRNSEISNITPQAMAGQDGKQSSNKTLGPLTEKLLSALMEEDGLAPVKSEANDDYANIPSPPMEGGSSSWVGSAPQVEKRIRDELVCLGILGASDEESEDEILSELLEKQAELRKLAEYNQTQLGILTDTATEYMKQQEIRHRIDAIDDQVCDTYRNFMLKKHKKIPYSKKEKDQASKLLQEREELNKQLQDNLLLSP